MALTDSAFVKRVDEITSALKEANSKRERESLVASYLKSRHDFAPKSKIPEFDSGLEWLNCKNPLSFKDQLHGKLCVLDFFTYCCINCMHILPDLEALEQEHSEIDGVVVVGVHSAKFENEKSSANILSAIIRYDIRHPVVNDAEAKLWHILGVACWPTLLVVGPEGEMLLSLVGEGHRQTLIQFIGAALKFYKKQEKISDHSVGLSLARENIPKTKLSFPGKICGDDTGKRLVVADTGHNRILVMSTEGVIHNVIGGGPEFKSGFKDGTFHEARFHAPQGVALKEERIYVADTENHAVREINLESGLVTTVTGTGSQGSDKEGGGEGRDQVISSPWDVVLGPAPGPKTDDNTNNVLYIAMAGTHQIWALYLQDGQWLKGGSQKAGTCVRFAGSGAEENRNNSYPHKASFAQPSGLVLVLHKTIRCLFVADSESSSIRSVDISTGATKALVGAHRDPTNLFAFGDIDGKGVDAKLQHPLGVTWNQSTEQLFVADSYNHKIKTVSPTQKLCSTFLGSGKPDPGLLDEPGGLCISPDGQRMYVADTNNHAVRVIDLITKQVSKLNVIDHESHQNINNKPPEQTDSGSVTHPVMKRLASVRTPVTQRPTAHVMTSGGVEVRLHIVLPSGCHLTEGITSKWQVYWVDTLKGEKSASHRECFNPPSGIITEDSLCAVTRLNWPEALGPNASIQIEAVIYFCEASGTCRMDGAIYEVPLINSDSATTTNSVSINHTCKL